MAKPSFYSGLGHNVQGALWMLAAACTFVSMTSLVRYLGPTYPATLQNFYRQASGLVVLLPLIALRRRQVLYTDRPWLIFSRGLSSAIGTTLQFYSYQHMTMAEANAMTFTRPLWVVPLAALMLGETVGWVRIGAVMVGFCGVLVMLQPWSSQAHLGLAHVAALASAFFLAFGVMGMKALSRTNSPMTIVVWTTIIGFVLTLPQAVLDWRTPSLGDFILLTTMGVFGIINTYFFVKAMSIGDAVAMAPLDYTRLVLSVGSGFLLFSELPTHMTLIGAGIIIISTLYITWREQRLARLAKTSAIELALEEAP